MGLGDIIKKIMEAQEEMEHSLLVYLRQRVMPILEPLQFDIMTQKPSDIHDFSYLWLQNYQEGINRVENLSSEDEEPDEIFNERIKKKVGSQRCRKGVSGESSSTLKNQQFTRANQVKCEQDKIRILVRLRNCLLFKNLSEHNIENIISCMKPRDYTTGEVVIRQGEEGDELYMVDSGIFQCYFNNEKKQTEKIYESGEIFGELSLLYNTKRASTIVSVTEGRLFSLDRLSYNSIIRDSVMKKTTLCEQILSKNELFESMKPYEKYKLIENIKEISFPAGKYVIKQGQLGDRFFIVAEGKLVVEKTQENGELKSVFYYKEGDYFGEIALIRNVPRQANVKTLTTSKLLFIERSTFKRLLGPLEEIMRRNEERYRYLKTSVKNKIC